MAKILYEDSRSLLRTLLKDPSVAPHLARIRAYHPDTYRHCVRVGALSLDLGIENRITTEELVWLGIAALLHDVGKIGIPIGILDKRGRYEDWERDIMAQHPRRGYFLLQDQPDEVRRIIVGHHEYNPDPYPRTNTERRHYPRSDADRRHRYNAAAQCIIDLTQIVAAADQFDALSSGRVYKNSLDPAQVQEIMEREYRGSPIFRRQVLERAA